MLKKTCLFTFLFLCMIPGILFSEIKATLNLPIMNANVGETIDVPIIVSTDEIISFAQFVVEYNSSALNFISADPGSDASNFDLTTNSDLPYEPTGEGVDENVLTQLVGGITNTFTGQAREVIVLKFTVKESPVEYSPLLFDQGVVRTYLTNTSFQDISGSMINFINGSVNFAVPVELSAFEVSANRGNVLLEWRTESETNNFGFEIQRSENLDDFKKIGFVPGHGTSSHPQRYIYLDPDVSSGTFFYRLKQIDTDGSFHVSGKRTVTLSLPVHFLLKECYPNPFNPETTIEYQLPEQARVTVQIYDVLGHEVKTLVDESQKAGYYRVIWDGRNKNNSEAASGVYFYLLKSGKYCSMKKMILIR